MALTRVVVTRKEKGRAYVIKQLSSAEGRGARLPLPSREQMTGLDTGTLDILDKIVTAQAQGDAPGEGTVVDYDVVNNKVRLRLPKK